MMFKSVDTTFPSQKQMHENTRHQGGSYGTEPCRVWIFRGELTLTSSPINLVKLRGLYNLPEGLFSEAILTQKSTKIWRLLKIGI